MTMYLSNEDVRPTGNEPAEFIEPPTLPAVPDIGAGPDEGGDADDEPSGA